MAKLLSSFTLIVCCAWPLAAAERYIIPHAVAGSPIYVQNATSSVQVVKLLDQYVMVMPMTTERLAAVATGSVVIDSTAPILAWSVVEGATFVGMAPASQITLTVTGRTGIAIASDSEEQVNITI